MRPTMLRRVAVTLVALARAAPWTPELAHDGTTPWDGPAMIRAELKRSVAAYAARTTAEDARKYAASLARHGDQLCVFLGGRLFVSDKFLDQSKHKKHAAYVLSAHKRVALPNALYLFEKDSTGGDSWPARTGGDPATPLLVISKKKGYGGLGVLVPNPFFENGDVNKWGRAAKALHEAAKARPWESRRADVFWRGNVGNHAPNADYDFCDRDSGNYARFEALSLAVDHPETFDVKCQKCRPRNASAFPCPTDAYDATMAALVDDAAPMRDEAWVDPRDYSAHRAVLNLPGTTAGGYSRNLNHLWVLKAPVLLWDAPFVEHYYPALRHGDTHLAVDRRDALSFARSALGDAREARRLAAGAMAVYETYLCPQCLAAYLRDVYDELRDRFALGSILDGGDDPRGFLRFLACAGAPVAFREVVEASDRADGLATAPVDLDPC